MTPSQEKELKYQQSFKSYKNHKMDGRDLIIECETESKGQKIQYWMRVGVRGGKITSQYINGKWIHY